MTRRQALEDLFIAVKKKDLLTKGVSEKAAFEVSKQVWNKAADNKDLTVEDIKRLRDVFLK